MTARPLPLLLLLLVLAALLLGCSAKPEKTEGFAAASASAKGSAEHQDEPGHAELPKRVKVSADVIAAAKIRTAPVAREPLQVTLELPGEITADPDRMARVTTPAAGRIERVDFVEGKMVKARSILALVRVSDLGDRQAALGSASAKATAARANARRLEALAAKGLAAEQELADAKAQAEAIEAEARGAGERLRALDAAAGSRGSLIELRAPIDGTVVSREAVVGQPADPDRPIATIVDLRELWFQARVFEHDLARVATGSRAEVKLNAYPDERFDGEVAFIGRQVDPVARTVLTRIKLGNRDDLLRLGLFGTAQIAVHSVDVDKPGLVVPRSAVTEIGGKTVTFVRHPDDDFELHEVVLGRSSLGKVQVLSGMREGEAVVVEGVFTLKSIVLKSTLAEED